MKLEKKIKIAIIFIITFMFLPICCLATNKGKISDETVRMRKEPSTDSSIITLLSQGFEVEIIEQEGDWYKVKYGEYTGYVYSDFVTVEAKNEVTESENKEEEETNKEETAIEINTEKQVNNQTKIYYLPLIHSEVMGIVEENEEVYIIQTVNGWAYIRTDNQTGWIRKESIENKINEEEQEEKSEETQNENIEQETNKAEENEVNTNNTKQEVTNTTETTETTDTKKIGYINAENVNFRKSADKTSEVIDTLTLNTEVEILSEENGWYKISVNSQTGYVATTLISDEKVTTSSRSLEEPRENITTSTQTSNIQSEIVEYAKTFLGCDYVYGGTSPSGFDCSGLVQYVYKHFGYSVSRSSTAQAKDGTEVSLENLELGDILIFKAYNDYSRIGHVGLYIGNNQFIHANDEKTGVIITSLSYGKYPERFVCGRRIV